MGKEVVGATPHGIIMNSFNMILEIQRSSNTYAFCRKRRMVRPPGFEPGSEPWKGSILTRLDYGRSVFKSTWGVDLRLLESQRIQTGSL